MLPPSGRLLNCFPIYTHTVICHTVVSATELQNLKFKFSKGLFCSFFWILDNLFNNY